MIHTSHKELRWDQISRSRFSVNNLTARRAGRIYSFEVAEFDKTDEYIIVSYKWTAWRIDKPGEEYNWRCTLHDAPSPFVVISRFSDFSVDESSGALSWTPMPTAIA